MTLVDSEIHKAYLHNGDYSAFPNEKEILLAYVPWKVEDVSDKDGFTMIKLRDASLD